MSSFDLGSNMTQWEWVIMRRRGVSSERRRSSCSSCRFWPTAYGDTIGATTGVNISNIVWVADSSHWSRAYAIQSMILFVLTDLYLVFPVIRDWSATERRNWSSIALSLSTGILVWFHRRMGRLLNSCPLIPNEARQMHWMCGGADGRTFGSWQILLDQLCGLNFDLTHEL